MPSVGPKYVYTPPFLLDGSKQRIFDRLLSDALDQHRRRASLIKYACPFPKHEFLTYLAEYRNLLIHGSQKPDLDRLEPRADSDNAGRAIRGVFAASDGIWPIFFAILDRKPYPCSVDSSCRRESDAKVPVRKCYHFATSTLDDDPWAEGMVHILPRDTFEPWPDARGRLGQQWLSRVSVQALAKLAVEPADFPFLSEVTRYPFGP